MSYNPCSDPVTCPNGECSGCKNGQVWCQDPRCQPYCPNCNITRNHEFNVNMTVIIILICLIALLFIVWFIYGPQFFQPHDNYERANVIAPPEYYTK
jgi:hypothetical protein